jgi:ATP-binding cassette subfamily B protein
MFYGDGDPIVAGAASLRSVPTAKAALCAKGTLITERGALAAWWRWVRAAPGATWARSRRFSGPHSPSSGSAWRAISYRAHTCSGSLAFFSRKKTGSLITRVTADTDRLWDFLAFGVVDVSLSAVMLLGLGVVLISLDWRLGLAMVLPMPVFSWFIYRHGEQMSRLMLRAWRKWSRVTDVLSDTLPGIRVVKAFHQEEREIRRFTERNDDVTAEFNRLHRIWTTFWPALMLGVYLATVVAWALAVPRLLGQSGPPLSPGTFVSFLLYATMLIAPMEIIGQMARTMNRATTSAHRVFEILDTEPDVTDQGEPVRFEPVRECSFEHVTFAYDGVRQVLRGVSFEVEPGEFIGLVGPSGGGKTTVVNRWRGSTTWRVDGAGGRRGYPRARQRHFRRQVGMVLQDPTCSTARWRTSAAGGGHARRGDRGGARRMRTTSSRSSPTGTTQCGRTGTHALRR